MTLYAVWIERPNAEPVLHSTTTNPASAADNTLNLAGKEHHFFVGGIYKAGTMAEYQTECDRHLNRWLSATGQTYLTH